MTKKKVAFVNRFTGEVKITSKQGGKKLTEDFSEVKFVKNQDNKPVMRFELEGATVDILENDEPAEVAPDGIRSTE